VWTACWFWFSTSMDIKHHEFLLQGQTLD
jgi:hypothetical protein